MEKHAKRCFHFSKCSSSIRCNLVRNMQCSIHAEHSLTQCQNTTILWDLSINTDRIIDAKSPGIIIEHREDRNEISWIGAAAQADGTMHEKLSEYTRNFRLSEGVVEGFNEEGGRMHIHKVLVNRHCKKAEKWPVS